MKVGITFSTFDLFHAGHVKMLEEAKRHCDYCKEKGIEIYYNSRDHRFSSTGLRKQVKKAANK